jgi:polyisoprenoid-binding protein YceI
MSKTLKILLAGVLVLVVAGGAFAWWFLRDDAPDEVDLGAAVESVEEGSTTTGGSASSSDGVDGTWTVVADTSSFDFDDTAAVSFVGFRVNENLSSIGSTTAVGRTPAVSGEIAIDGTTLTEATFDADMTAITTNESRRDSRVQSALGTDQFPTATFELTSPVDLGDAAAAGGPVTVTAVGDLTVHGVTQPVEIPLEAQLAANGQIVVIGSMAIVFGDYGVTVPSAPVVVSADDHGILEVQLFLSRA